MFLCPYHRPGASSSVSLTLAPRSSSIATSALSAYRCRSRWPRRSAYASKGQPRACCGASMKKWSSLSRSPALARLRPLLPTRCLQSIIFLRKTKGRSKASHRSCYHSVKAQRADHHHLTPSCTPRLSLLADTAITPQASSSISATNIASSRGGSTLESVRVEPCADLPHGAILVRLLQPALWILHQPERPISARACASFTWPFKGRFRRPFDGRRHARILGRSQECRQGSRDIH